MDGTKFGDKLRELRLEKDLSMGQVARAIGVTTVYYSAVENGRQPAFPEKKVNYQTLAAVLGADVTELSKLAADQRGNVVVNLNKVADNNKGVVISLARMLNDNSLSDEQIEKIRQALEGEDK